MSTSCALCERADWLDTGICSACAGNADQSYVFLGRPRTDRDRDAAEETLRDLLDAQLERRALAEVISGGQPLVLLRHALAKRAAHTLEETGLRARVFSRVTLLSALPLRFGVMVAAVFAVGLIGGLRNVPVLLSSSPLVAATLLLAAYWHLRTPLLVTGTSSALLPEPARSSLADTLAQLEDARARTLLIDVARMAEATFQTLPAAFRTAALGESVIELVREAGPLAREAAHLRAIASELGVRADDRHAEQAQQIDDAANARFALLEDVVALLGRIARDGARSDEEVTRLLQLVRAEAARRVEAEGAVAALLQVAPSA